MQDGETSHTAGPVVTRQEQQGPRPTRALGQTCRGGKSRLCPWMPPALDPSAPLPRERECLCRPHALHEQQTGHVLTTPPEPITPPENQTQQTCLTTEQPPPKARPGFIFKEANSDKKDNR